MNRDPGARSSFALLQELIDGDSSCAFLSDLLEKLSERPLVETRIETLSQAWVQLAVPLIRFQEESQRPAEPRRNELARQYLVAIAATAWRAARDLGIETRGDAIGKDIPF